MDSQNKKKFDYSKVIIVLTIVMILTGLGFCSSNKSLYLKPITEALGVTRSAFSVESSIRYIATAVLNVFFGALVMKFGTKKLILAGFGCLIGSTVINIFADSLWHFYISGALLGIGFSWTSTTMAGCVINRWCSEKKGTVMGFVLASNGLGGALAAQLVAPYIHEEGNPFGYRNAYKLVLCVIVAAAVVLAVFFKDKKDAAGVSKSSKTSEWEGITISEAKKKPYFYVTLACIFLTGMMLQGITGISSAHMEDIGLNYEYIAAIASMTSIIMMFSKIFTGFMYDKKGLRFAVTICNVAAVICMLSLGIMDGGSFGKLMAVVYTVTSAVALPLETVMLPNFAIDLMGQKSFDKALGLFVSLNTAGYALGTPLVNVVYDVFGTYKPILFILAGLMVIVSLAMQYVITAAHGERKNS